MDLKSRVLSELEGGGEWYISGGELAVKLSVSRNAVWKAIEFLRAEGYTISAVPNKGYRMDAEGDVLSETGITALLGDGDCFTVETRKSVTSTNDVLRDMAANGVPEGFIIAAEHQTAGKGRLGRVFYSPKGTGVYFSILLRPMIKAELAALITSAAAVAVAQAIEEVCGVSVGIKWVNDLFCNDKKVCGILTEASFDMESGLVGSAVLGIGINITPPENGFPTEFSGTAGALVDGGSIGGGVRNRLVAYSVRNFWRFYKNLAAKDFLREYRERSIILGGTVTVLSSGAERQASALEIDDNCALVVRYDDGETAVLNSGEVSIRKEKV